MVSKKDRKNSGRYTPVATISPKEAMANNIFINEEYDDWNDRRDGFRDWFRDFKMIKKHPRRSWASESQDKRERMNKKQELLLKRRKARRIK